ncbi:30S ribosomal protein S1 [Candidatus Dojkabacteria bacterium]|uniref:30S ribosomal protein S1 n=1 Tax=Candidatus Dojkabacteria bacterium TaxID=2099670 RepID=A0A955RLH6_9BACT|nr:30S ribosomal protein S1 [Candidatus Dojkabacteria bacterium]
MAKFQKNEEVKELETLLNQIKTPQTYTPGDVISGTVMHSDENMMLIDVGARSEGVVAGKELKLDGKKVIKKVGEKVLVYVVTPENKAGQVELSIRKTGDELKWHELQEAKENDDSIMVKVLEANTGGVIVEIGGGLRGFVPSSQLKNSRIYTNVEYENKEDATKKLQSKLAQMIDEELEVKVMEIDREKNRVILSEKWVYSEGDLEQRNETLDGLKVGDVLTGKVTGIAPFGLFVNAEGLEGLVHLSEISWDKVSNPGDFHKVGDDVEVQVIGLNDGGKRVAYSIKRLKSDPWKDIVQKYKVGELVEGVVSSIADYGAFVKVEDGLNGLIHISELSHNLVKDPRNILKIGEKIKVMIISISNEDRHLGLSLKRLQKPPKKSAKKEESSEESLSSEDSAPEMAGLDELISGDE